jgi:hypothetical protein
MTEPTAALIAMVVSQNKTLKKLDLSSNRLGPVRDFIYRQSPGKKAVANEYRFLSC